VLKTKVLCGVGGIVFAYITWGTSPAKPCGTQGEGRVSAGSRFLLPVTGNALLPT